MITLGPYTAGEIPPPVVVTFTDAAGAPINITGYAVRLVYRRDADTAVTRTGAVDNGASGIASYTWVAADMATAGSYRADMWVGNGTNRYASQPIAWVIREAVDTAPAI